LMDRVWSETSVEENNLTQQISALRKAFGERAGDHKYIVTVPGRGYCFVMPVHKVAVNYDAGFRPADQPTAPPETLNTGILALFRSETIFGYGLAAVYILAICIPAFFVRAQYEARGIKPQSIAILQFRSSGLGDELLGMGIRDTLRAKLGSLDDITVRPAADLPAGDVLDAGKQVHADVVLTGSIQRDDDRVRVAVEMVDVNNEQIVWGNTFDNTSSSAFELQDSIAAAVLSALRRPRLHSTNRSSQGEKDGSILAMIDRSLIKNLKYTRPLFA
jgi:TolB-like protein